MPIGGSSYTPFLKIKEVLNQGATSDSPAVQSPKRPQTQGTSFLPKADATKTYSPAQQTQLEHDLQKAEQGVAMKDNSLAQSRLRQWPFLSRNKNTPLPPESSPPLPPYSNDQSDIPTDGSVMTSDEAKKRFAIVPNPRDVTMGFNKIMAEKDKDKKGSSLSSPEQLPATLPDSNAQVFSSNTNNNAANKPSSLQESSKIPTFRPKMMTSTELRQYLKTLNVKAIPKEVKNAFNNM